MHAAAEGRSYKLFGEFEALFEADPNGVLLVGEDGLIAYANQMAGEIFRGDPAELTGVSVDTLLPEAFRDTHARQRETFVQSGQVRRMGLGLEFAARRLDGTEFPSEIGLSTVRTDMGALVCVIVTDISERKRLEAWTTRVKELTDALSASLTPEEVARAAVQRCAELVGAVRGSVTLWNDETERLEVVEHFGYAEAGPPRMAIDPRENSAAAEAFRTRTPVIVRTAAELAERYPEYGGAPSLEGVYLVVPLAIPGGGVVGTLNLIFPPRADPASDIALVEELGRLVAQATDRARLYAAERRARQQADALARASAALSAAPTLQAVAEAIVREGTAALGASGGFLIALDSAGKELRLLASAGFPDEVVARWAAMPLDTPVPLAEAVRTGQPIWLETAAQAAAWPAGSEAREMSGFLAAMVAPLTVGQRAIGAVSFNFPGERRFAASERSLVQALAALAGHAFERATLYETAERARRTTEAVIEQMPVAVAVAAAPSGRIIYMNAAVDRIWRSTIETSESVEGYGVWRGFHADGTPYDAAEYPIARSVRESEVIGDEEMTIRRGDGTRGVVLISSAPVHDETGAVIAAVATGVDVTERAQAEALQEAFMGILSHELRTPVTSILGGARLLASDRASIDDNVRHELTDDIAAEAERLHRLVENLLVIARAERGMEFEPGEPVLLQYLVPTAVTDAERRWPAARFELTVEPGLPPVQGEATYVSQIIANLISNAVKYSPSPASLTIRVERQGDGEVAVRVLDRGIGISAEGAARLFEAFYRAPDSARTAPGAGIGLFVVRRLVDAMHGRTWAKPREGGGSEFGFALPIVEE